MVVIKNVYAESQKKVYDADLVMPAFMSYIAIWMLSVWMGGGYDKPVRPLRTLKPILIGTAFILIAYSLLPENLRFSRALILFALMAALLVFILNRAVWNLLFNHSAGWSDKVNQSVVIVGGSSEVNRVKQMLEQIQRAPLYVLSIDPGCEANGKAQSLSLLNLEEIIRVHQIQQVIYCARDIASSEIIASMSGVSDKRVEFKIAPPESLYIIGSGSIESTLDGSMMDVNSVQLIANRRNKRVFDVAVSIVVLLFSPLLVLIQKRPIHLFKNAIFTLLGRYTWIGYSSNAIEQEQLPKLKRGVLTTTRSEDGAYRRKMDILYAKDYRVANDLRIVTSNLSLLGS
jgi:FlaA1/EpsC-like NDP-sugar epimerase